MNHEMEVNPLTRERVKQVVSAEQPGFYRLGYVINGRFLTNYIGRSDNCLRKRLLSHVYDRWQSHFVARPTETAAKAYRLECLFYHLQQPYIRNEIHPAQPDEVSTKCPYCHQESVVKTTKTANKIETNAD